MMSRLTSCIGCTARLLPVLLLSAFLTACGGGLTQDQFNKIETGMTEEQVKALIGSPGKIDGGSALGVSGATYIYKEGKITASVVFVNGKVFGKQFATE